MKGNKLELKNIISRGVILMLLAVGIALSPGCGDSGISSDSNPIVDAHRGKDKATLLAATTNVRAVRSALMGYLSQSADGRYPQTFDIYEFDDLRRLLPQANLPPDMTTLKWDPAGGIRYDSDGTTFSFSVTALTSNRETITATPREVTVNR